MYSMFHLLTLVFFNMVACKIIYKNIHVRAEHTLNTSFLKIFNPQAIVVHSVLRSHVNVFVNDLAGHHVEEDQG